MGMYRTVKPMIVDAVQCTEAKTIATDLGFINVQQGEWVICGQGGETYIVDDAFFQSTFVSVQENSQIPTSNKPDREIRSIRPTSCGVGVSSSFHRDRMGSTSHRLRRRKSRFSW
jgi:hypothetical protein